MTRRYQTGQERTPQTETTGRIDYSYLLTPEHRTAGYTLRSRDLDDEETDDLDGDALISLQYNGVPVGHLIYRVDGRTAYLRDALIETEHRRKGLSVPLFEAALEHARQRHGCSRATTGQVSTMAGRTLRSLARRYKIKIDLQEGWPPANAELGEQPYDGRYRAVRFSFRNKKCRRR